jgi:hypothetical protein
VTAVVGRTGRMECLAGQRRVDMARWDAPSSELKVNVKRRKLEEDEKRRDTQEVEAAAKCLPISHLRCGPSPSPSTEHDGCCLLSHSHRMSVILRSR